MAGEAPPGPGATQPVGTEDHPEGVVGSAHVLSQRAAWKECLRKTVYAEQNRSFSVLLTQAMPERAVCKECFRVALVSIERGAQGVPRAFPHWEGTLYRSRASDRPDGFLPPRTRDPPQSAFDLHRRDAIPRRDALSYGLPRKALEYCECSSRRDDARPGVPNSLYQEAWRTNLLGASGKALQTQRLALRALPECGRSLRLPRWLSCSRDTRVRHGDAVRRVSQWIPQSLVLTLFQEISN